MRQRPPVSGAFDAYRAERTGRRPAPRPAPRARRAPTPSPALPSAPRRAVPASARRPAPGRRVQGPRTGTPLPPSALRRRMLLLPAVAVLLFGVVTLKLVDVQVRSPERFRAKGELQRVAWVRLPAGRGSLLDRNGQALALSVQRRTVFADPSLIDDPADVARQLAPVLDLPRRELQEKVGGDGKFVVLARTLEDDVADEVEALAIRGVSTFDEFKRFRPNDDLGRSVLGTVSDDGAEGISGLELQLDGLLTGAEGEVVYERAKVDGGGAITGSRRRIVEARPGADVTLTLDQSLQYETERVLADHLARAGAQGGIAIVSRPSTGEILALANLEGDEEDGGFVPASNNLALTTVYEPGSVNKVITVAAALEEGLVTPESVLDVADSRQVGDHLFTDSHPHPTSSWSVTDIVATSSNVGTIMLAQELGADRVDSYLRRFGFGEGTGLDFPAESSGILLPTEQWHEQSTAIGSIPIGQGISVTALQMLQAFNVLGNDGTYVPARLVRGVTRADGTTEAVPSGEAERVVSAQTAAQVRAMLAQVVARGTGQAAAVPGYEVAGKTGTARKPQSNGTYRDEDGRMHYIATFAGLLPAENPDLSVIVVVDEPDPSMSIYAGQVAAPAFSDIARIALRRLEIPSTAGGQVTDVPELSDSAADVDDTPVPGSPRAREEEVTGTAGSSEDDPTDGDPDDPAAGDGGEGDATDADGGP